jgi:hypothetical protein
MKETATVNFEETLFSLLSSRHNAIDATFNEDDGEKKFIDRICNAIDEWQSSWQPPEGHTRFFHGTSAVAMTSIIDNGIDSGTFNRIADFGPGFCCVDKVLTTLRFAHGSAILADPLADTAEGPYGGKY